LGFKQGFVTPCRAIERVAATIGGILKNRAGVLMEQLLVYFDLNDGVGLFFDDG
jgi:hypothetical protein